MAMDTADQETEPKRRGGPFQFFREVQAEAKKVTWATGDGGVYVKLPAVPDAAPGGVTSAFVAAPNSMR